MSASADISLVHPSALNKKSSFNRITNTSRHILETKYNADGAGTMSIKNRSEPEAEVVPKFASEGFRIVGPSKKVLDLISLHKASSVASLSQNQEVCNKQTPSQQKIPSQKKQSSKKKWFDDEPQIQDAVFKDYSDEYESRKKEPFEMKKAPERKLGIAKKDAGMNRIRINHAEVDEEPRKTEPGAISAIAKSKDQIKQSFKKRPSKNITAIDAFDYVVDTFKEKNVSGKSTEERPLSSKRLS